MQFRRPGGNGEERKKYVVALRTSAADRETDVPVVICSTDRAPEKCRRFEVQLDPHKEAQAPLSVLTKVDCRWVFTLPKSSLGPPLGELSAGALEEIGLALYSGLQLG